MNLPPRPEQPHGETCAYLSALEWRFSPTPVFRTRGGKAADGIRALQLGTLRTSELAAIMGLHKRRVDGYLTWARKAGAVVKLERGRTGGNRGAEPETLWGIGPTPVEFGRDHRPYKLPQRNPRGEFDRPEREALPVRRRIIPAADAPRVEIRVAVSVFGWRP